MRDSLEDESSIQVNYVVRNANAAAVNVFCCNLPGGSSLHIRDPM